MPILYSGSFSYTLPAETPFEDGTFKLVLTFDESYPNKPPTVKFLSKMFHPNVYANGELCLDILQNRCDLVLLATRFNQANSLPLGGHPHTTLQQF